MIIKSLENTRFEELYDAFSDAFSDYDMQLDRSRLKAMLLRRGFVPGLSFGAFEGERMVSFTFNGIGNYRGIRTAYDTGTGTRKAYRSTGLATSIFRYSIPILVENGIKQYLLEVLSHNVKAVSLYKKLGFEISREFSYFSAEHNFISIRSKNLPTGIEIRETDLESLTSGEDFHDFHPSWQNSFESVARQEEEFILLGGFHKNILTAYCIFEPASGDISQIAVRKDMRRQGIGTKLLESVLSKNLSPTVKFINAETSCDSLRIFLDTAGILMKGRQYEMIRKF